MKPCRSVKKIESIMSHHVEMRLLHTQEVRYHEERIEFCKDYIRELKKPGFKTPGYIKAGTSNHGNVVIAASNTFEET